MDRVSYIKDNFCFVHHAVKLDNKCTTRCCTPPKCEATALFKQKRCQRTDTDPTSVSGYLSNRHNPKSKGTTTPPMPIISHMYCFQ